MMDEQIVKDALYRRYIEPTKNNRENSIGVEIELPIVNLSGKPVDFGVVHEVTEKFREHFKFRITGKDSEGNVYAVTDQDTGDILSFDCSYNNLELSFGKEKQIAPIYERFRKYFMFIQEQLEMHAHILTGMGVNPYRQNNKNVPVPNGRYRMLFHYLHTYDKYRVPMYFHNYPDFGTFSSASQVQLDVDETQLTETINTFSKLEPIKALLFSNSVIPEEKDLLCCRDLFWENSTHGINPHNVGMYDCEFSGIEEIQRYIESESIYCVEREDKYINFEPVNILEYFQRERIAGEYYENGAYKKMEFQPELSDITYLRPFKYEDLTFRGTIEFRSVCCQPVSDVMTVAAFHLGLKENLHKLTQTFKDDSVIYHQGYTPSELRSLFVKREMPSFVNKDDVYLLAERILDLSEEGLANRGYGEEKWLLPLYERVRERTNPAKTMLKLLNDGMTIEEIIKMYGRI